MGPPASWLHVLCSTGLLQPPYEPPAAAAAQHGRRDATAAGRAGPNNTLRPPGCDRLHVCCPRHASTAATAAQHAGTLSINSSSWWSKGRAVNSTPCYNNTSSCSSSIWHIKATSTSKHISRATGCAIAASSAAAGPQAACRLQRHIQAFASTGQ